MQFSLAFSWKLHRVSISSGNRPRCTKCVSILSSKDSEHCSIEAFTARWQLIYYIRSIFICQELFQNFFRSFWSNSLKTQTFLTAVSFETAYLVYQTQNHLSRTFFILFKPLFSSTAVPLGDSFNRIPPGLPSCQQLFSFVCNLLQLRKKAPLPEPFYYCANWWYIRSMVTMACSPV